MTLFYLVVGFCFISIASDLSSIKRFLAEILSEMKEQNPVKNTGGGPIDTTSSVPEVLKELKHSKE